MFLPSKTFRVTLCCAIFFLKSLEDIFHPSLRAVGSLSLMDPKKKKKKNDLFSFALLKEVQLNFQLEAERNKLQQVASLQQSLTSAGK